MKYARALRSSCLLLPLLLVWPLQAGGAEADGPAFVPPGFEALLEKQTTLLDVYFGGEFLLTVLADYNVNEVQLRDPEALIRAIPELLDPQTVRPYLNEPLAANSALRCYSRGQDDCGLLVPDVAGIIFNEDKFRVDLFIHPDLLALESTPIPRFLPESDAGWSFLQNLSTAFAGDENDVFDRFALNAASMVARGETRFLVTTSYANATDWTADNIVLRRDSQGREYQAGYFQTENDAALRFIPEASLRGLRIASTLDTRTDLERSTGQELTIFLSSRSRVAIFKEGRLVSSANYEPGNQALDTSRLPGGAYPITLRIEDSSGRVREEERFYVKSSRFPPADQLLWGVELGEQVRRSTEDFIPNALGDFYGRVALSGRLADALALRSGLAIRDSEGVLELGLDHLHPRLDVQASVAASSDSGYGLSATGRSRFGPVTFSANYRETWSDDEIDANALDAFDLDQDNVAWFQDDSQQVSGDVTWFVGGGVLSISAQRTRSSSQEEIEEFTAAYSYPLLRSSRHDLYLDMELSEADDLSQVLLSLTYRWDRGGFNNSVGAVYERQEQAAGGHDDDLEYSLGTTWRDPDRKGGDLNVTTRASHRSDYDRALAELAWRDRYGELVTQVEHQRNAGGKNNTTYVGNLSTSVAATGSGVAFGGDEQSRSAIVVRVDGDRRQAVSFEIHVNGTLRGTTRLGERTMVALRPFETYNVELVARGDSFVEIENPVKQVTLYPGNVAALDWDVSELHILFGRLLDNAGRPVANAVLRGASGLAMTDARGNFQAEVRSSVQALSAETRDFRCAFTLPDYELDRSLGRLGTISCSPEAK
ncbi:MAG: hypothetical protein HKN19_19320 [Halioglobus sp.]|nr:hypothetical protein [Halioglobus sp.]